MERNIVFCCDGTANQKGKVNTNVVHLLRRIPTHGSSPREPHSAGSVRRQHQQILAYEPGVGTFSPLGFGRENVIGTTLGKLFGHGLTANIENGYRFPMPKYRPGDRIYPFGFPRARMPCAPFPACCTAGRTTASARPRARTTAGTTNERLPRNASGLLT